jgi:hypothetical protein
MSPVLEVIFLTIFFTGLFLLFHVHNMTEILWTLLWHGLAIVLAIGISQLIYRFIMKN